MKLLSLKLRDFLSHHKSEIDFVKYDCCLISGKNGAGKSAIFEGILWALFGKSRTVSDDRIIKLDKDYCKVSLQFEIEKTGYYKITRERWRDRKSRLRIFSYTKKNKWKNISSKGKLSVEKQIQDLLNMNSEIFISTVLFSQGKADQFTKKNPSERKKLLSNILGIDVLESAEKIAKEEIKTISISKQLDKEELKDLKLGLRNLNDIVKEIVLLRKKIKKVNFVFKMSEKRLRLIERKIRSTEDLEFLKNEKEKLDLKKTQQSIRLEKLEKDLRKLSLEYAMKDMKELREEISENKLSLKQFNEELRDKTKRIFETKKEIQILENFHAHFTKKLRVCPICDTSLSTQRARRLKKKLEEKLRALRTDEDILKYDTRNQVENRGQLKSELLHQLHQLTSLEAIGSEIKLKNREHNELKLDYWATLKSRSELKEKLQNGKQEQSKTKIEKLLEIINTSKEKTLDLSGRLVLLESDEYDIRKKLKQRKVLKKRLLKTTDIERINSVLVRSFGRNGMQALIIDNILPDLEIEANKILSILTDETVQIEFKTLKRLKTGKEKRETLDIWIEDSMGRKLYESYSGGEKMRINLAIRIALSRLLSHRAGTKLSYLLIDEITDLDEEGIDCFLEMITRLQKEFEKIIVISHLEKLQQNFPQVIEVEKIRGESKIVENV